MLYRRKIEVVRLIGLEPTRPKSPDPKSGASTNFATSAFAFAKVRHIFGLRRVGLVFSCLEGGRKPCISRILANFAKVMRPVAANI